MAPMVRQTSMDRQFRGLSLQSIIDALRKIISYLITRVAQVFGVGAPGSKHFKLCIISKAMPAGNYDGVLPSGIRGDGACSFYAVFLGYLDAYGNEASIRSFEDFLNVLLEKVRQMQQDWKRDAMIHEIESIMNDTLDRSILGTEIYPIMSTVLDVAVHLKDVSDEQKNPDPETFNRGGKHDVYISTNRSHLNLYLSKIPRDALWRSTFNQMWTKRRHPILEDASFEPGLSTTENWQDSPAK